MDTDRLALVFLAFNIQVGAIIFIKDPIDWHNAMSPIILAFLFYSHRDRFSIDTYSTPIILLFAGVTVLIPFLELYDPPIINFLAHVLALFTAIGFAITLSRDYLPAVFKAYFFSTIPVVFFDLGAFFDVFPIINTCSSKIPGLEHCGIGTTSGFATHGIILVSGIVAGLCILHFEDRRSISYRASLLLLALMFVSLILSQSRSSILAFVMGVSPLVLYKIKTKVRSVGLTVLLIAGLAVGYLFFLRQLISFRVPTVISRLEQVQVAIEIVRQHPVRGIGWNEFFPTYYEKDLHNTPLNYFVFNGIVSGFLYLGTILIPIIAYVRVFFSPTDFDSLGWFEHASFGIFLVALTERLLAKGTPSVQLLVAGVLFCSILSFSKYSTSDRSPSTADGEGYPASGQS